MGKIIITQIKSSIDRPKDQKATLRALGLTRIRQSVEKERNPQIDGMVRKIMHLVEVSEVK
ncbi:MAG: 50S ribosomal protein L30 [Flavobacteriales bacterium]|nr:50S ribosomal protein L30 [Flavobacteriales bacterium]HCA82740.1 50S ribosomal protein L30 [Flavobacteriales bacterium]HRE73216.1 50S ribosomal protein L30 [Flavobacteriales bacterium]HRJ35314.1 50S ribosomal protein L30 [Flavobacteriales bacterium]HRJ38455.1 50S ribosomal protein L30 [Flavobacteriales bacterium]